MTTILVPAALAGLVAVAVTVAIERWGGRIGGLLGTLPTTIVPAAAGIAVGSATDADFRAAMAVMPAGMLVNVLFLYLWRILPPRLPQWSLHARLAAVTAGSLAFWFAGALAIVTGVDAVGRSGAPLPVFGWALTAFIVAVGVAACRRAPPAPPGRRAVDPATLTVRGLVAATAIGVAVWLAANGGALAAGVAAVFPAIFLTTMVSLWLSQGETVPSGAVGPMMLGSTGVAVYAMLAAWSLPALGMVLGSLVAWVSAVGTVTVPAWWWLGRRGV